MSSGRPYISLLWQAHTMEDHSVRSACWLAWLLTSAFFLCSCSPVDHMSVTVCIYLSAHLKSFLPFPLFLDTWPQPTSGPPCADSLCSFSSLVLPGMVWKEVSISVDFPVETLTHSDFSLGINSLTSVFTAAARLRLIFILLHVLNISCFLILVSEMSFLLVSR